MMSKRCPTCGSPHYEREASVPLHYESGVPPRLFVWLCPACGEPLAEGERCECCSRPEAGPLAVKSTDLARALSQHDVLPEAALSDFWRVYEGDHDG